jgi:hypothetical protein
MITVVDALQLLEECTQEPDSSGALESANARHGTSNRIVTRALALGELRRSDLTRYPLVLARNGNREAPDDPLLTLGAFIAFRTADRFARAGASPQQTLEASYRAARRYLDIFPAALRNAADRPVGGASNTANCASPRSVAKRERSTADAHAARQTRPLDKEMIS